MQTQIGAKERRGAFAARAARKLLWILPAVCVGLSLLGAGALACHLYLDRDDLPDLEAFLQFQIPTVGRVYDANGRVMFELAHEYRRIVSYAELPPVVRDAILSAEDKNFFSHSGVDYSVFPRVVWKNLTRGPAVEEAAPEADSDPAAPAVTSDGIVFSQGGSTITQQLVRAFFLTSMTKAEKGDSLAPGGVLARIVSSVAGAPATNKLSRKLEEMRLSLWLEEELERRLGSRRAAKEAILSRYASLVYMGSGRYGFAAASEYYFGKALSSYTIADAGTAAVLAGIMKCPRDYAPSAGNTERILRRRNEVLDQMVRNDYLSAEEAEQSRTSSFHTAGRRPPVRTAAPAVVGSILSELKETGDARLGFEHFAQGRIVVHSTAHAEIQAIANEAFDRGLAEFEKRHPSARGLIQGAVVVLANDDARILAEVGGRPKYRDRSSSYTDFNRATNSFRQPGSAMKPIVYLAAFSQGASLDQVVPDAPISVDSADGETKWINNYDGKFKGTIPVRKALAESRNAATVWIANRMGMRPVLQTARRLGVTTPLRPFISTALGASEMSLVELANAYRAIASGLAARPHSIQRVTDAAGTELFVSDGAPRPLEVDRVALQEIQEGLRGVVRLPGATAGRLNGRGFPSVMGKTGTSSGFRDAVFVGSTYGPGGITVGVRFGYDDNGSLGEKETGARVALPVFQEIMLEVYAKQLAGPAPRFPSEIEEHISEYVHCVAQGAEPEPGEAPLLASAEVGDEPVVYSLNGNVAPHARPSLSRCATGGLAFAPDPPTEAEVPSYETPAVVEISLRTESGS